MIFLLHHVAHALSPLPTWHQGRGDILKWTLGNTCQALSSHTILVVQGVSSRENATFWRSQECDPEGILTEGQRCSLSLALVCC